MAFSRWMCTEPPVLPYGEPDPVYSNLWFGFEVGDNHGYAVSFSYDYGATIFRYSGFNYINRYVVAKYGDCVWDAARSDRKIRLMFGKVGKHLLIFANGDCLLDVVDSSYNQFSMLKMRFRSWGSTTGGQNLWLDNMAFYSDPVVTCRYLDAFGIVKQTQVFDGTKVLVAGSRHTLDGLTTTQFKPVAVDPNPVYGPDEWSACSWTNGIPGEAHRSPFDYMSKYLDQQTMYTWQEGYALAGSSHIYGYYHDTAGAPACMDSGSFVPYSTTVYANDPLRRPVEFRFPGEFRQKSRLQEYGRSDLPLPGFEAVRYGADSVFKEKVTDENGHITITYKDKLGRTIGTVSDSIYGGTNAFTRFYADFNGNDTLVVQPEGQQIRRKYNNVGWLVSDSSGDYGKTTLRYDQNGNMRFRATASDVQDARFHYFKYDRHSRLIEEGVDYDFASLDSPSKAMDPDFPRSSGPEAALKKITATYDYDQSIYGRGRLTKATRYHYPGTYPESASWETYEYDAYGRLIRKSQFVDAIDVTSPRVVNAEYNLADQITKLTYPNGKYVTYAYDKSGMLSNVKDGDNYLKLSYTYWPDGKVKVKALGTGTQPAQVVDYTYNARGWPRAINDGTLTGNDQFALGLTYEQGADRGLQDSEFPAGYYNGNVSSYRLQIASPAGVDMTQRYAYDGMDRLMRETYSAASGLWPKRYSYDRNGCLLSVDTEYPGLEPLYYHYYPGTNRIECMDGYMPGTQAISYTPTGSVATYGPLGLSLTYNYHDQLKHMEKPSEVRPVDVNTVDYWYNTAGKRIAKEYTYWYCYDCGDPGGDPIPTEQSAPGGGVVDGASIPPGSAEAVDSYDLAGSLPGDSTVTGSDPGMQPLGSTGPGGGGTVCYTTNTVKTGYYYFGDDQMSQYSGPNAADLMDNYVYANGERVARFKDAVTDVRYYLTDHLGSVVATVQRSGFLCNSYGYLPWGTVLQSRVIDQEKFSYTGKERDGELGMNFMYYGARYYDPNLRVFLAVDPLANKYPSWSPYAYSLCNPVTKVDRDGKWVETAIDIVSVGLSLNDVRENPSLANFGWLALDVAGALLPFVPAVGVIRHSSEIGQLLKGTENAADAAKAADKTIDAAKAADNTVEAATRADGAVEAIDVHHRLPRAFEEFFTNAGLKIDDYTASMKASEHRLKPDGIHTNTGGAYNRRWEEYIRKHPEAKDWQILDHLDELEQDLGMKMVD